MSLSGPSANDPSKICYPPLTRAGRPTSSLHEVCKAAARSLGVAQGSVIGTPGLHRTVPSMNKMMAYGIRGREVRRSYSRFIAPGEPSASCERPCIQPRERSQASAPGVSRVVRQRAVGSLKPCPLKKALDASCALSKI